MNLYQAFGGNPVNFVDPWGEQNSFPKPTKKQAEANNMALTTPTATKWRMNPKYHGKLKNFYEKWLSAFAKPIKKAAKKYNIPAWLITSIILGEVTAMNPAERTLEGTTITRQISQIVGGAKSLGMAQIRFEEAVDYGLTPSAQRYTFLLKWYMRNWDRVTMFMSPTERDYLFYRLRRRLITLKLQSDLELLNPLLNIEASARYFYILLYKAAVHKGKIQNYAINTKTGKSYSPWGKFDFTIIGKPGKKFIEASAMQWTNKEKMLALADFFGAAHNSDAHSGFKKHFGLTQGENARAVLADLIKYGLIFKFGLK